MNIISADCSSRAHCNESNGLANGEWEQLHHFQELYRKRRSQSDIARNNPMENDYSEPVLITLQ
jgi:hypothetical protein